MSSAAVSPRTAAIRRLLRPEQMPPLFEAAANVPPGDQPPPFTAQTGAGETIEIVAYHFTIDLDEGTLPILTTAHGARYIAWASSGPELTAFGVHHVEPTFLLTRLAQLRAELETLERARAHATSIAQDQLLQVMSPLELDAYLIQEELARKGVPTPEAVA